MRNDPSPVRKLDGKLIEVPNHVVTRLAVVHSSESCLLLSWRRGVSEQQTN